MTSRTSAPVIVGADGSAPSLRAVEYAAAEAALRRRPLLIVHAYVWPPVALPFSPGVAASADTSLRRGSTEILNDAAWHAARVAPGVAGDVRTVLGDPAAVLLELSDQAELLVLGTRGVGGFAGMMLGSVAAHTAAHARCPVMLVRGGRTDGPVVVGVDGSPGSSAALDFAADEADRRGARLVALHAWNTTSTTELNDTLPMTYESWDSLEEHRRVLAEALAGIAERHPDLAVQREVRHGTARQLLTDLSGDAQLVVVGSRGHGGFAGLLLGSVSQHLIYRAGCPVAVVRPVPAARRHPLDRSGHAA
ncbi:universal stress protein [Actinoplanes sp. L3-i22]|uniref:universal stress protein n=1 Tax=Actinoplanes sp. L3-i22 TaxID=2836373 RepID=UPI001C78F64A|nr:universal stress protein [Actinoplanes sp. L3-i22]BCY09433.1 universal stress protein [Actinoplanes sp. L3-i22]